MLSAVIIVITICVLVVVWFWWWAIKEMEFNDSFWAKKPEKVIEWEPPLSTIGQAAFLSVTSFPETWNHYRELNPKDSYSSYCGWRNDDFKLKQDNSYPYGNHSINGYSVTSEEYDKIVNVLLDRARSRANQAREKVSQELLNRVLKKAEAKLRRIRKEQAE